MMQTAQPNTPKRLNIFERYLTLWVVLCIIVGISIGKAFFSSIQILGKIEIAHVNLLVAILIWLMIIPMLLRIDLSELKHVRQYWRGIGITLFINWIVKPFSMAFLAWIFIKHVFPQWLPASELNHYIAGLIILSAAPCTAMVFVWSYLCDGEPHFTLTQVVLNDLLMIFLFAPIIGLLLGLTHITVPWSTLLLSVLIYIVVPFIVAQLIRYAVLQHGKERLEKLLSTLHPYSIIALLVMLVLLFGFQGEQILSHPLIVLILAVPIIIQVYFTGLLAYGLNYKTKEAFCVAAPSALIGASNFFELAVATAISLFGFTSGAALATVVGVLVEVPVMLSIVKILEKTRRKYEAHVN